ncbi:MAG: hypothetical protein E7299_04955 [Lachnospiraceae bacterium]|nr:hypothetical protein [Lachnospiraceae bacterium]
MLSDREIEMKLYDMAAVFKNHMRAGRYPQAKYIYDKARMLAVETGLEEKKREELFGLRGERGNSLKEGLFPHELVQKAYLETCVKAKEQPEDCILCQKQLGIMVQK